MPDPSHGTEQAITVALAEAQHQRFSIQGAPRLFIALTKLDGVTAAALRAQATPPNTQPLLACAPARRLLPAAS